MHDERALALTLQRAMTAISEGLTAEGFMHHAQIQRNHAIGLAVIAGGIAAWGHWVSASIFGALAVKSVWHRIMARRMATAIRFVQAGY